MLFNYWARLLDKFSHKDMVTMKDMVTFEICKRVAISLHAPNPISKISPQAGQMARLFNIN